MGYVALDEFAMYRIGTGAWQRFGNVQGGDVGSPGHDMSHNDGVGGMDDWAWGMIKPSATIECIHKGETLLANCLRGTWNALPAAVGIWGGVLNATSPLSHIVSGGYVDELTAGCGGIGELVKITYKVSGLLDLPTVCTGGQVATNVVTEPFSWQAGAVTIASGACGVQDFSLKVANNLAQNSSLDAKATGVQRFPEEIDPGNEEITLSVTIDTPLSADLLADFPDDLPITASLRIGNGFTNNIFTFAKLYYKEQPTKLLTGADKITWALELETKHNPRMSEGAAGLVIS